MSNHKCESVASRLLSSGVPHERALELLAITFRNPTIKRFEGIDPDAEWRLEVDEALSDLVGVILSEGYRIESVHETHRTETREATSCRIWFEEVERTCLDSRISLEIDTHLLKRNSPTDYDQTFVAVLVAKYSHGTCTENRTRISFRSTTNPIDVYDLMVDGLIPGIERLARFVAGTCEYM